MAGLEGQTLDRYELEQLTGRGGMADVYRAFDPRFERTVAVKVFKREDEDLLRRFVREARLMASLSHAHLIPVYDTGVSRINGINYYYIVMPFMTGGSLRARVRRGPLPPSLACRYLREVADALDYIHERGIIHRDIKSSNVLLDDEGTAYLADFGIARMENDSTQATSTGSVLGTVDYVAPELFESDQRASSSSDIYSLGVMAYEMVTGRLPFTGENQIAVAAMHVNKQPPLPRTFVPNLPMTAERVLLRGLEKRPEYRYQTAMDFADAFCESLSARAARTTAQVPATAPVWDEATRAMDNRDEQLVLPPVPPVQPSAPGALSYGNYDNQQQQGQLPASNIYPQYQQGYNAQNYQADNIGNVGNTGNAAGGSYASGQQGLTPPQRGARTRVRIVTILAVLALLAVIGPILYVSLYHPLGNVTPTPTATTSAGTTPTLTATSGATATATPNLTATAQVQASATAHASATAVARATATAQAQASATPGVIQTATAGTPLYQDALNNANSATTQQAQWDQNNNCGFQADGYHITLNTQIVGGGQFKGCHEAGHQYQNMTISVNMSIHSGHSGGLFFHLTVDSQALGAYSGYLFELDTIGRYKISRSANFSTGSDNATLQNWTTSSAIKPGNAATNTLQVIANGNNLMFYVNGTYLTTIQDSTYTSGGFGFLATTANSSGNADIVYSNVGVYAYPAS